MNLLGEFEGYRNGKWVFLLKLKTICFGIIGYIFLSLVIEQFTQNPKILAIIKIVCIIGIISDFRNTNKDGKQIFSVYENVNHKLMIKGQNSRGKTYTDIIDEIAFDYEQKYFKNKADEKVIEEHFQCKINKDVNLFVFYHLENDNKTMEKIIKDNELNVKIVDKFD